VTAAPHPDRCALFVPDGDRLVPTELSRGPWSPDALHGGPVAALVIRAVERHRPGDDLQLVRLTLELLRPVPLAPLTVRTALRRDGRKVQVVEVTVAADGTDVARALVLRLRALGEDQAVRARAPEDSSPPPPEGARTPPVTTVAGLPAFHSDAVDMRFAGGLFGEIGPATVWIRLRVPVVPGEDLTPWQRVAAAADFGNGVSSELDFRSHLFINPDLTVYVHRPPIGEWVCLDARTRYGTPGIGMAESALWDAEGRIGRAVQCLLIERLV
jgi:acyl-Coa thioesterase superfamily protein/acyl-CoA thioesterase superfamily protein